MTTATALAIEQFTVAVNGIDLFVATSGPRDGPVVMLLHGFPEFSYGWRRQIPALAAAGFRVVVPDQRGYGFSTKPDGVAAYALDTLVDDVVALGDALGHATWSLVGHDWGGIVAWRVASDHPARLDRLAILNAPNLDIAFGHLLKSPMQLLKSYYVALSQLPVLPEWALSSLSYGALANALRLSSAPGTFGDDDLAVYREAWSQPGALTSMLNWYRALPGLKSRKPSPRIATETLVLWGDRDSALDASLAEDSAALCDHVRIEHVRDATHWLHHEQPHFVNECLTTFLSAPD